MSSSAVALVMLAAIAHASWNLFGKQAAATGAARFIWLLAIAACVVYLPVVVATVVITRPHLAALNWVFLAGSGVLHSGYFLFLQRGYRLGDLSAVYPIGRGSGAMLAAFGGIVLLGERPNGYVIAGIVAIIGGVLVIGQPGRAARPAAGAAVLAGPGGLGGLGGPAGPGSPAGAAPPPRAVSFALVTGVFIACYTIWDAYAVSHLHTQPIVQCYASFVVMGAVFAPFALKDRERLSMVWHAFGRQVLGAAVLAPLAYILVLTALSFTAVAAVAPAREVSVLFGVVLGRRLLGEGHLARRLTAGAAIVTGIILIAIA